MDALSQGFARNILLVKESNDDPQAAGGLRLSSHQSG
jgi:hypothetical protein